MWSYLGVFGVGVLLGSVCTFLLLVLSKRFHKNLPNAIVVSDEKSELRSEVIDDDYAFKVENSR